MINDYLKNGELSYYKHVGKKGNVSKDIFKIEFKNKTHYLLCTFDGVKIVHCMLIS